MGKRSSTSQAKVAKAASIANISNSKRGRKFQTENDLRLQRSGIPCRERRIMTSDGIQISDHSYEGKTFSMWAESTLSLDMKKAKELVRKRFSVLQVKSSIQEWAVYYEHTDNKKSRKSIKNAVKYLENNGWTVCIGVDEIDVHISLCMQLAGVNKKIPIAKSMNIAISKLLENSFNRRIIKQQIIRIAKSILQNGFTSNLSVIPFYKDGIHTGKYILFDGHHRLAAIKYLIDVLGYSAKNFAKLPCIVVDWVTSEDKKELHRILTTTNWTTTKWSLRDYIRSYREMAYQMMGISLAQENETEYAFYKEMYESYKWLYDTYKLCKKHGLPEGKIVYRVGPCDATKTFSLDLQTIKEGDYRVSEEERKNKLLPFILSVLIPFEKWYRNPNSVTIYVDDVSKMIMRKLVTEFKADFITLDQCISYTDAFKNLGKNVPVTKDTAVDPDFWDNLDQIVKNVA